MVGWVDFYTMSKSSVKKVTKRSQSPVQGIGEQWDADLMDMQSHVKENESFQLYFGGHQHIFLFFVDLHFDIQRGQRCHGCFQRYTGDSRTPQTSQDRWRF